MVIALPPSPGRFVFVRLSSLPRPLSDRESAVLDLLLSQDFAGVAALRTQRESVRAMGLWQDLGGIVVLEVCDEDAPKAAVVHTVPVETRVLGADPPLEVLLFVKHGLLESIELVSFGGSEPVELPAIETLATPTINLAGPDPPQPRTDR